MNKNVLPLIPESRFIIDGRLTREHLHRFSDETIFAIRTILKVAKALRFVDVTYGVETKNVGVQNLVTVWDKTSSRIIQTELKTQYANDPLLSEEVDKKPDQLLTLPRLWVVDELDGTFNASRLIDYYSIAIAFVENGKPTVGVVYFPPSDKLYYGEVGVGTFWEEASITVREATDLATSSITTNASYTREGAHAHLDLIKATGSPRITVCGSTVMSLTEVAAGKHELGFTIDCKPWDRAAPEAILSAGGRGVVKGIDGRETTILDTDVVVGSETLVHQFVATVKPLLTTLKFLPKKYSL